MKKNPNNSARNDFQGLPSNHNHKTLDVHNIIFQIISSTINDAIIASDASQNILFWNKGAEHIFGYASEEAIGQQLTMIISKEFQVRHEEGFERLNCGGEPRAIGKVTEAKAVRKNGEEFPIELTLGYCEINGNKYYSGIIRDVTIKKKNEQIIHEQNKRFQVISSSKNDAIITSDESNTILFWNKGAEHIFGYACEEAVGQPLTLIIPQEFHKRHNEGLERMSRGGEPHAIGKVLELSAVRKSGEEFPIELTLGYWESDNKRYFSGIIRDITVKKKNEQIIQEQNKRFQVISSSKNDAIITSDESNTILFWNKGAEHIFGYACEEAVGQPLTLIIPQEFHKRHNEGLERMSRGGEPHAIGKVLELSAVRKSGEEFPIELTLGYWESDNKRYFSGIIRDITVKKKNEQIIQEQNKRFQVISSSKNDAIITSDESNTILFWNKGAEHIFGYACEEAVGQPLTLIIPQEFHKRHNEGLERMSRGGEPRAIGKVIEARAVRKDGEIIPIELTLGFWESAGKRYFSGIIRDITEKKRTEKIILDEIKKSDDLLLNILPKLVATELKNTGKAKTKKYENVSILFTDFESFTTIASTISPTKLVNELNEIFSHFDDILGMFGVEKIKTIGDAYFAACGVPEKNHNHAVRCVEAAKLMLNYLENRNRTSKILWKMRVGIHSGPVVAGVVSKKKYAYDLFGDTVNTASRMESNGEVGKINVSESTFQLIKSDYECVHRGQIHAKGKGNIDMYFVKI